MRLPSFISTATVIAVLLLSGAFSSESWAQTGRIEGRVTDAQTGGPLPGANIIIQGTNRGAASDVEGRFVIQPVPVGDHTLLVTYIGYQRASFPVQVRAGEATSIDIQLSWEGVVGDEVVITAQAAGQTSAINQQLASNTITNIVSRDRIQELPDVNAAESIGRLPGVSIQRSGGEANKVAIRGLSPKHNAVTVNGVRMPATGGDDRSVDLSLVASNMLDGIEVTKAITPDQDADAIGGSVELRLREAPAGLQMDISAQGGYTELRNEIGNYKIAATASNRFLSDRLGVIGSFTFDRFDRSADKLSAGYQGGDDTEGRRIVLLNNTGLREENVARNRRGGSLVMDYRIPRGKITGNTFYNRLGSESLNRINLMEPFANRHYFDLQDHSGATSIWTGALNIEQDHGWFSYAFGVSRTSSVTDNPNNYEWRFGQEGNAFTTMPVQGTHPTELPSFTRPDTSATALSHIWVDSVDRSEYVNTTQLDITVPFRMGNLVDGYVKTGGRLRWLDRTNDEERWGRAGLLYGTDNLAHPFRCMADIIPEYGLAELSANRQVFHIGMAMADYTREDFMSGDFDLGMVADRDMMMEMTRAFQECEIHYRRDTAGSMGRDYEGEERHQAGYAMAEFNIGPYVTFMPGFRYEADWSRYRGQRYAVRSSAFVEETPSQLDTLIVERDNQFFLPMVHLQVKPTAWLTLRLARTESLTRPDFMQYAPITSINAENNYVRAANSLISPAHSTNYDAALSVYQRHVGLFTVAGFTKAIDDLIMPINYRLHPDIGALEGMNVPDAWVGLMPTYGADTYINSPHTAEYRGFELDWQTNFWYLPSVLKGIVLNINYTYIFSEMTYEEYALVDSDELIRPRPPVYRKEIRTLQRTGRMPDQPAHIANVTLGYDIGGFSIRGSMLYQDDRSNSIHRSQPVLDQFSGDYLRFDASVRQRLAGRYDGLEIYANFNNINGRPDENFISSPVTGLPTYTEFYGFTMDIGARYRF